MLLQKKISKELAICYCFLFSKFKTFIVRKTMCEIEILSTFPSEFYPDKDNDEMYIKNFFIVFSHVTLLCDQLV